MRFGCSLLTNAILLVARIRLCAMSGVHSRITFDGYMLACVYHHSSSTYVSLHRCWIRHRCSAWLQVWHHGPWSDLPFTECQVWSLTSLVTHETVCMLMKVRPNYSGCTALLHEFHSAAAPLTKVCRLLARLQAHIY